MSAIGDTCTCTCSCGRYATHLTKYYTHFGRQNVLVERSEDFYANEDSTVGRVLAFGGLSEEPWHAAMARAQVAAAKAEAAPEPMKEAPAQPNSATASTNGLPRRSVPSESVGGSSGDANGKDGAVLTDAERNVGRLWGGSSYAGALRPTERRKLQLWYAPRPHRPTTPD